MTCLTLAIVSVAPTSDLCGLDIKIEVSEHRLSNTRLGPQ